MIEKTKELKQGSIREEDVSSLLQRYTATTVLALLQEVDRFEAVKIDWNALVKNTKTGISNPREYQMLWRYLAYHHALLDKLDDGAQPLDDDSDLEFEVEEFPEVSSEASAEAAACVKVMVASGIPSDSSHTNNSIEAPLTINVPNGRPSRATSENFQSTAQGMNITVPVSVQKQALPAVTSFEGLDTSITGGTIPARRKRKPWSSTEDMELMAAVKKFGEGNWANILRGEFKGDRTASQLSQRWAIIRKRHNNLKLGTTSSGVQLSEAQQAARHAMNLALDPPKSLIANNTGGTMLSTPSNSMLPLTSVAEPLTVKYRSPQNPSLTKFSSMASTCATKANDEVSRDPSASTSNGGTLINGTTFNPASPAAAAEDSPAQHQSQQCSIVTNSSPLEKVVAAAKSQLMFKKPSTKPNCSSDPMRAASVAAGAHIATQSDAASLFKTAQAKNVVHVMPSGGSSTISSFEVAAPRVSSHTAVLSSSSHAVSAKAYSTSTLDTPLASVLSVPPKQTVDELITKQDVKPAEACKYSEPEVVANGEGKDYAKGEGKDYAKGEGKDYATSVFRDEPSGQVKEDEDALHDRQVDFSSQPAVTESCNILMKLVTAESELEHVNGKKGKGCPDAKDDGICDSALKEGENCFVFQENGGNQNMDGKQTSLPVTITDSYSNNLIAVSTLEPDNGSSL